MLVDTDVIIWFLRGNQLAEARLNQIHKLRLSVISYMELVQGMRNKQELQALQKTVQLFQWQILPVDDAICQLAVRYVENYSLSHAMRLADALIAATAVYYGLILLSANDKHYSVLSDLKLEVFRP
ncbi:type II toxin-antitoxin system VapC family toxin [Beggiatoa leptomitoformis]|uniref:Ribonuclease VapC n=1 Tax=Beggiatoa leptomitoformis TaxID=288004 RepID=A0A2N9YIK6_9GAMM|nr:type II toxin-antitoxin system VapC family toxin [Beggiatoa leptomitoformis]ALG67450.1 PIN domain-containing protein [Beggiatoa leptomitoformis]AUI70334.1 PIN domain-containing protein [Beggiatoa leptomitoformis]